MPNDCRGMWYAKLYERCGDCCVAPLLSPFETTWTGFAPSFGAIRFKMLDFLGSISRGDDREGGDLDILVEPTEVTTLFDLAGLKLELEALLGVRVDIATPGVPSANVDQAISDDLKAL